MPHCDYRGKRCHAEVDNYVKKVDAKLRGLSLVQLQLLEVEVGKMNKNKAKLHLAEGSRSDDDYVNVTPEEKKTEHVGYALSACLEQ